MTCHKRDRFHHTLLQPTLSSRTAEEQKSCCVAQGLYRPWKVLEFYYSEFQALESPGKRHRSWNILESPGIINQRFWNF